MEISHNSMQKFEWFWKYSRLNMRKNKKIVLLVRKLGATIDKIIKDK